jgi:hypothetical protein
LPGDGAHRQHVAVLDGDEYRIARLRDPGHEDLRGLVAQPSRQHRLVVPMVGNAQLGDRPSHDQTGGSCILDRGVANFHRHIMLPGRIRDKLRPVGPT